MNLLPGLSGFTCTRNAHQLDYCVELAILSMLPICDEVVVCDSDSTDGTREWLDRWASEESKLRVINWPWPNPVGETFFFVRWMNFTREHLRHSMMLLVEGDECLHENSYKAIRSAAENGDARVFERLNFWGNAKEMAPIGHYCNHMVARMGPTDLWMPSDAPDPHGSQELATRAINAGLQPGFQIFHYGALRKPGAFIAKSRVMQGAIFNTFDSRLAQAEKTGEDWVGLCKFKEPMRRFVGSHPSIAHGWLRERGHTP